MSFATEASNTVRTERHLLWFLVIDFDVFAVFAGFHAFEIIANDMWEVERAWIFARQVFQKLREQAGLDPVLGGAVCAAWMA